MPTYDYRCEKCKKNFEAIQSMNDSAFRTCPKALCQQKAWGKGTVRRMIGKGVALIFKGSGFHATDYRSEAYKFAEKKEWGGETRAESAPRSDSDPEPQPKRAETKAPENLPPSRPAP
jgi:putative FmdB family regulatory protein